VECTSNVPCAQARIKWENSRLPQRGSPPYVVGVGSAGPATVPTSSGNVLCSTAPSVTKQSRLIGQYSLSNLVVLKLYGWRGPDELQISVVHLEAKNKNKIKPRREKVGLCSPTHSISPCFLNREMLFPGKSYFSNSPVLLFNASKRPFLHLQHLRNIGQPPMI